MISVRDDCSTSKSLCFWCRVVEFAVYGNQALGERIELIFRDERLPGSMNQVDVVTEYSGSKKLWPCVLWHEGVDHVKDP